MAKADGQSFANPFMSAMDLGEPANPFMTSPTANSGLSGLAPSLADMAVAGDALVRQNQFRMPEMTQPPAIAFSPSRNKLYVNGVSFDADDAASALDAEARLQGPSVGLPQGGDWQPLSPDAYQQYLESIRNPSTPRLFKKNFGRGVDTLQLIGGGAIQGVGDLIGSEGMEQFGADIVMSQIADLNKTSPFQREFSEIDSGATAWDWAIGALGQAAPSLLESVAVALGSAAIGFGVGNVPGALGGGVVGLGMKEAIKKQIKDAALKKAQVGWAALDKAEKDVLRKAAAATYAAAGTFASNYAAQFGESYLATEEAGVANPYVALLTAAPAAALDSLVEVSLFKRVFGGTQLPGLPADASRGRKALQRGLYAGREGFVYGAAAEGLTEGLQEGITSGLAPVLAGGKAPEDLTKQIIEAGAAGALTGTVIGTATGLVRRRAEPIDPKGGPKNLLENPPPPAVPVGGPEMVAGTEGRPDFVAGAEVRPSRPSDTLYRGQVAPGQFGGAQGVLDLGGPTPTIGELRERSQQTGELPPNLVYNETTGEYEQVARRGATTDRIALPPPAPEVDPRQMALQFAPPAPEPTPAPNTLIAQQMAVAERRRQLELAQQQQAAQREADLARLAIVAQNQRQLDLAQQAQQPAQAPAQAPLPMVAPPAPRAPQQMSLFSRREAPIPSRAEGIRRGVGTQPVAQAPVVQPRVDLRRSAQVPMFTQQGEPSMAALRSAGTRQQVVPTVQAGATQIPPTGAPVTPASAAAARAKATRGRKPLTAFEKEAAAKYNELKGKKDPEFNDLSREQQQTWYDTYRQVKEQEDAVQEQGAAALPVQPRASRGKEVGQEVRRAKEPAGKGEALKGKAKTKVDEEPKEPPPTPPKGKARREAKKKAPEAKAKPAPKAAALKKGAAATAVTTPVVEERVTPEEAWEDMKPEGAPTLDKLPAPMREVWVRASNRNQATMEQANNLAESYAEMQGEATQTPLQLVQEEINAAEEATGVSLKEFGDAIATIVEYAYFVAEETNTKAAVEAARAYLGRPNKFSPAQMKVIGEAMVEAANSKQKVEAVYTRGKQEGEDKPWFNFAIDNDLLPKIRTIVTGIQDMDRVQRLVADKKLAIDNFPKETQAKLKKMLGATPDSTTDENGDSMKAVIELSDYIRDLNTKTTQLNNKQQTQAVGKLKTLWEKVRDVGMDDAVDHTGTPLSAYFTDNEPITTVINKKLRVVTTDFSPEQVAQFEADERFVDDADDFQSSFSLDDWDNVTAYGQQKRDETDPEGRYFRDDGTEITKPVAVGRVRLMIANFMSGLAIKPKMFVFANQADMKAKNPKLYAKAVAARPQGDFDTASAVGYSFGDGNVVIFTDRVATERQLKFVLAHETLGHFGMRALIGDAKFSALMNEMYDRNPTIRDAVDAAMVARKMSKPEAVEEYLADFAALLDVSLVARIWNAIKGVLNKLGVEFGDEAARYFVSQARRYVRTGQTSAAFSTKEVGRRLMAFESGQDPDGTGRFAQSNNLRADNILAGLMRDNIGGAPMKFDELGEWINRTKASAGDAFQSADKFLAKFFSLLVYRARENPGFSELNDVINEGKDLSMRIKVAMKEKLAPILNRAVAGFTADLPLLGGITTEQTARLNSMLYAGQRYASSKLKSRSALGREQLFSIGDDGQLVANQKEIDRLFDMGTLTFEQMKNGFTYEVEVAEDGGVNKVTDKFDGVPNLTEDSIEWKGYVLAREAVRDVELELLQARYLSFIQDRNLAFREIADLTQNKQLTPEENRGIDRLYKKYRDLFTADKTLDANGEPALNPKSIENANNFVEALNAALIGKDTDRNAAVAAFFEGKAADDTVAFINEFKKRLLITDDASRFMVQNRMKDIIVAEISNSDADLATKNTLSTGYTPVLRKGEFQVRVIAYNKAGRAVAVQQDYKEQFVYSQVEKQSEALELSKMMNEELFNEDGKPKFYNVRAFNENTRTFEMMEVRLEAKAEAALTAVAAPPELNLNEFVRGLRRFNINLRPEKLEQVVVALTAQNSRARQRLKRAFTPGADTDAVSAISQHVESRASTVAKILMRPRLNELMNLDLNSTQRLWNGDADLLARLKKNWEAAEKNPNASYEERLAAKLEYDRYAFMFAKTNPETGVAKGNQYYNEASSLLSFMDNNKSLDESDFGAGEVASRVRATTSMLQLGASIATGALNYIGALTNGIPYLATYNEKTAFGGGFGFGKSMSYFYTALSQVGLRKAVGNSDMDTATFYDKVARDPKLQKQYGLTDHEARFLAREIREGVMIPAQSNALVDTARGRTTSGLGQKTIDGVMWTFNATEQAARRGLGLASYRLAYERQFAALKSAGKSDADASKEASAKARVFAVESLRYTVGEYSVMNRPPAWKGGIQSFIYMYKVFPTTSIQLLNRLPRDGKIAMLFGLWMLSGVAGFPFAEDMEDLVDTLWQRFFGKASMRYEFAKLVDSIVPGLSPFLLKGMANYIMPADIASRTELGNFIPGTGILLAGANVGKEAADVAGPAFSMLTGLAGTLADVLRLPSERVTVVDVLRESPMTMMRAFGDTLAYIQSGAIVDKRGYVVSPDLSAAVIMTRMLGFYPAAASQEYEAIRVSKRIGDYQRETSAAFRTAWVKARIQGDFDQARAVEEAVASWNESARGTPLEIRNFKKNASKAYNEAKRPAMERFLRTMPKSAREDLAVAYGLLGY